VPSLESLGYPPADWCRVIRHIALEAEAAEPPIGQVQMDLLAKPALRADAMTVADDQHTDQQLGID
jgi:hypothetical protein